VKDPNLDAVTVTCEAWNCAGRDVRVSM
jgi:hypothetical protein